MHSVENERESPCPIMAPGDIQRRRMTLIVIERIKKKIHKVSGKEIVATKIDLATFPVTRL